MEIETGIPELYATTPRVGKWFRYMLCGRGSKGMSGMGWVADRRLSGARSEKTTFSRCHNRSVLTPNRRSAGNDPRPTLPRACSISLRTPGKGLPRSAFGR